MSSVMTGLCGESGVLRGEVGVDISVMTGLWGEWVLRGEVGVDISMMTSLCGESGVLRGEFGVLRGTLFIFGLRCYNS